MSSFRGAWLGSGDTPKYPLKIDIRYGNGLLQKESSEWPHYFVVTTPSANKSANSEFVRHLECISYVKWLDWSHLQ